METNKRVNSVCTVEHLEQSLTVVNTRVETTVQGNL